MGRRAETREPRLFWKSGRARGWHQGSKMGLAQGLELGNGDNVDGRDGEVHGGRGLSKRQLLGAELREDGLTWVGRGISKGM